MENVLALQQLPSDVFDVQAPMMSCTSCNTSSCNGGKVSAGGALETVLTYEQ